MALESEVEDGRSPETVDRVLVGVCGAIWLVLLAVSVTTIVALVDLARGHTLGGEGKHNSWLLYSVIVVSALVILGAIPLLIKARRATLADTQNAGEPVATSPAPPAARATAPGRVSEAPTEKLRVFGAAVDPYERYQPDFAQSSPARRADPLIPATDLDRLWLRCTVTIVGAIGLALIGVSTATYLLAVGNNATAWVALGLASLITVAMPAVPVFYLRKLHGALEESAPTE